MTPQERLGTLYKLMMLAESICDEGQEPLFTIEQEWKKAKHRMQQEPACNNPAYYDVFGTGKERREFDRLFRPQSARPTNPATLIAKGDL